MKLNCKLSAILIVIGFIVMNWLILDHPWVFTAQAVIIIVLATVVLTSEPLS